MKKFELPEYITTVLNTLSSRGFEAFIVGGYVRDLIMGISPADADIATNAAPDEIMRAFSNFRTIPTGIAHGTVTVVVDSHPIEITTYRRDGSYADLRRPDNVEFISDLKEDLLRRDFTINALAYNEKCGIIDVCGGINDIEKRVLRCVGDADTRFGEDALRILRCLRFSSCLGFAVDCETEASIFKNRRLLSHISAERICSEFVKLLCGDDVSRVILSYIDVIGEFIPEAVLMKNFAQNNPHHAYDVLTHAAFATANVPPLPHLRLAAFLHDIGKPQCYTEDQNLVGHFYGHTGASADTANAVLLRLKMNNLTLSRVLTLVKYHDILIEKSEKSIRRWLAKLSPDVFFDLLLLKRADSRAQGTDPLYREKYLDEILKTANDVMDASPCLSKRDLNITGTLLIKNGFPKGPEIGRILDLLLSKVIDGEIDNTEDALIKEALKSKEKRP